MYIPPFNQVSDRALLLEAMRAYSFAILFGPQSGPEAPAPLAATHLPLVVQDSGPHGVLEGHFARANGHWQALAGHELLVVFPGPHAYVSPTLYEEPLSVPTWNYVAIHAYGVLTPVEDEPGKEAILSGLMRTYEPAFRDKWLAMPAGYRRTMLAGIMGFRIPIARIEGKFKLSQNRSGGERSKIHAAQMSGTADEQALAGWMVRLVP